MLIQKLLKNHYPLLILITIYLGLSFLTYKDYGITADEEINYQSGSNLIDYYLGKKVDNSLDIFGNPQTDLYFRLYPGILSLINFKGYYEWYHLLNLVFGSLFILVPYIFIHSVYKDSRKAMLASIAMITIPRVFGHIPANPKDIPFALSYLIALYGIYKFPENPKFKNYLVMGVLFGFVQMLRTVGFGIPVIFFLYLLFGRKKDFLITVKHCFLVFLISLSLMFLLWPLLHKDALVSFERVFTIAAGFPFWARPVLFGGRFVLKNETPWYYLFVWFGITTPLWVLVASIFSLFFKKSSQEPSFLVLMRISVFVNLLLYFIVSPTIYNGLRHFLFLLPIFVLTSCATLFEIKSGVVKITLLSFVALNILVNIFVMYKLHPYEYSFFNPLVGYGKAIVGKYEMEYWGASYKEAGEWLADSIEDTKPLKKVYSCNVASAVQYYAKAKYEVTIEREEADYIICDYERYLLNNYPGEVLYTVERLSIPYNYVIRVGELL